MRRLHVLLPSRERAGIDSDTAAALARGDQLPPHAAGHVAALAALFSWPGERLPAAALMRQHVCGDAGSDVWLCADPGWVEADINGARLMACANLDLQPAEAESLAAALRPLLGACRTYGIESENSTARGQIFDDSPADSGSIGQEAAEIWTAQADLQPVLHKSDRLLGDRGALLELTTPDRWHLRMLAGSPVPAFDPPDRVLGGDLLAQFEQAGDKRWRQLFTEIQTELHRNPVNAARRQRGQSPVNALWLWGGGALPDWVTTGLDLVISDDLLVQALASRAGAAVRPLAQFDDDAPELAEDTLLDLGQHAIEASAWQSILDLLRRRHTDELRLLFADGQRLRLRRGHRWRVWRRGP